MKKLANLKGAKALNKQEQQSINGGKDVPVPFGCAHNPLGNPCYGVMPFNCGIYCCTHPCGY